MKFDPNVYTTGIIYLSIKGAFSRFLLQILRFQFFVVQVPVNVFLYAS